MFVTYIGAIITTLYVINANFLIDKVSWFDVQITIWLWLTVLFANFAQSIAEAEEKPRRQV